MSLGAPLGLLALLAAPALVAIYFLRRQQPPRPVSALFLWKGADRRAEAGPKWQRFTRELSLLLELLAVLAAAAFLADLRLGHRGPGAQTVVVLDSSMSMSAKGADGATVGAKAVAQLKALVEADDGLVTVVRSGPVPHVVIGPGAPRSALGGLAYLPLGPAHDLGPSIALAKELAGASRRVRVLTDRPLAEPPTADVEVIALGQPLENTGFTGAFRRDLNGQATVVLRVARFGPAAQVPVEIKTADGKPVHREALELGPGEEKAIKLQLPSGDRWVATLPDDALAADNAVALLPNPTRRLQVAVLLPEGPERSAVLKLLAADGAVDVTAGTGDLTIAAEGGVSREWTLRVGAPGEAHATLGPFFLDHHHPLLEEVDLTGTIWVAGASPKGVPLVTAGDWVLLSEQPDHVFHLNADLGRSSLTRQVAFPVLMANLLSARRDALDGVHPRHVALGAPLSLTVSPGHRWRLTGPSGDRDLLATGTVRLAGLEAPGEHGLLRDGAVADTFFVEPTQAAESDLRDRASGHVASSAPLGTADEAESPRSGWPLLLLGLLLALDWALSGVAPRRALRGAAAATERTA
jgi:hypothetical protein